MQPIAPATVKDVVELLRARYPESWAEDWDQVGLVAGRWNQPVTRVHFAVDPLPQVVAEALDAGSHLIVTHHPLLLRGINRIDETTPAGQVIHDLIESGVALYAAHTNADSASGGVNDCLARAVGLGRTTIIDEQIADPEYLLITYVPATHADQVRSALADAGAGVAGDYTGCSFSSQGTGRFTPGAGAQPAIGEVLEPAEVAEVRIEVVVTAADRHRVVAALKAAHPYEEVAYSLVEKAAEPAGRGIGRIGELPEPMRLADFARLVAGALPATAHGVRVAGDEDQLIRTVAVSSGSGQSYLEKVARSGADVLLTADLRHHPASDFRAAHPHVALVDVAHWASEWVWLPIAAQQLQADAREKGWELEVHVSTLNTDPWDFRPEAESELPGPETLTQ